MRAVPANVVKGSQFAIRITHDKDTLPEKIDGDILSGLSYFLDVTDELPGTVKNCLAVKRFESGFEIRGNIDR